MIFRLAPAVFLAATGMTNCQYFTNVTIPATDTTPPLAFSGVYSLTQGNYVDSTTDSSFVYDVPSDTETYLAVGATMDSGGAASVIMSTSSNLHCIDGGGNSHLVFQNGDFQTGQQAGSVGQVVSDGIWVYEPVRFDQFDTCPNGWRLSVATYSWTTISEDFHGNRSTSQGEMQYVP
jgi:hypothetical protein